MILDLEPCAVTRCRTHYVSTSRHRLFADDEVKRDRGGYGLGGYLTVGRFNTCRQRQSNYQRQHRESLNYLVRHFLAPVSAFPALSSKREALQSCVEVFADFFWAAQLDFNWAGLTHGHLCATP